MITLKDLNGFFKVASSSGSLVIDTFFNPSTNETKRVVTRDYDYSDCSRDNDELYYLPIDDKVRVLWLHHNGHILIGDTVKVVKGRKIPVGTTEVTEVVEAEPVAVEEKKGCRTYQHRGCCIPY